MKLLWCWRCQQELPMLEGEESALVARARQEGMALVEAEAQRLGRPLPPPLDLASPVARRLRPMLEMYRLLTGFEEHNPNAVSHHVVALYGPACPQCRKPLRTTAARFCAACGFGMAETTADALPLVGRRPELFTGAADNQ